MRLSDAIEQFIKTMLSQEAPEVELKRNELAEYFNCAPSQINYVLATRFTPDHGYIIESRRGGGGYIRIFRMAQDTSEHLLYLLQRAGGRFAIDALAASHLVQQLLERELVTEGEAAMMNAALSPQALSLPLSAEMKDALRARILKNMLLEVARRGKDNSPIGGTYMLCEECGKNQATVSITVSAGGEVTTRRLCPECMKKMKFSLVSGDIQGFLSSVLSVLGSGTKAAGACRGMLGLRAELRRV